MGTFINHVDRRGGVSQITILFHKPYLVQVTTKGEGGQRVINIQHGIYEWPLGRRIPQKTSTVHNSDLGKVATLGGGGKNSEKNGYVVCVWPP